MLLVEFKRIEDENNMKITGGINRHLDLLESDRGQVVF